VGGFKTYFLRLLLGNIRRITCFLRGYEAKIELPDGPPHIFPIAVELPVEYVLLQLAHLGVVNIRELVVSELLSDDPQDLAGAVVVQVRKRGLDEPLDVVEHLGAELMELGFFLQSTELLLEFGDRIVERDFGLLVGGGGAEKGLELRARKKKEKIRRCT
jgi:hypothetical protein